MADNGTKTLTIGGKEITVDAKASYREIALSCGDAQGDDILLALEDGRMRELHHRPHDGSQVTWVTIRDPAGYKAYVRSCCLMMLRAAQLAAGGDPVEIQIHFVVSGGLYCTLANGKKPDPAFLQGILENMKKLRDAALPIRKFSVSTWRAIRIFTERNMLDKAALLRYRNSSRTNLYDLDGYVDYYYGYMACDTGCLHLFDIVPFKDGFVLRLPTAQDPGDLPPFAPAEKLFASQDTSEKWGGRIGIRTVGELNDLVVSGGYSNLILTQEAYHEKLIASIAQTIADDPSKKFIMIAGPSSSGKTTFSHRLSAQLSVYGLRPHPIAVDDYFVNREDTPRDENGNYNFECLEAIDIKTFNEDMMRLLAGEQVELPTYNFKTGKREYKGKFMKLGSNDLLVIEGIHCLNDRLSESLPAESKYKIYISALTQLSIDEHNRIPTTDGRLLRRIVRDARTRGNDAKQTIRMWPSVRRGETEYIFPFQESADVMINSALIYELAVLKVYAQPLLFAVREDEPEFLEARRLLKFLEYFVPIPPDAIPNNSLVREFIGGSCFDV